MTESSLEQTIPCIRHIRFHNFLFRGGVYHGSWRRDLQRFNIFDDASKRFKRNVLKDKISYAFRQKRCPCKSRQTKTN